MPRTALVCTFCLLIAMPVTAAPPLPPQPEHTPWPTTSWPTGPLPEDVDGKLLTRALGGAFQRHIGPAGHPDHRALLVVRKGTVVLESYAPGFGPGSRFFSWSMAKSITNALVGILVGEGRLALDAPPPIAPWAEVRDARRAITLRHLMNMTAGLRDDGNSGKMLFAPAARRNAYERAAEVAAETQPGTEWAYSMATSNLLGGMVSELVGNNRREVSSWAREALFEPIGARSFELEFDQTGHFIGGAFSWASARDWARLGLLFLRDGNWDGERILPEAWVDFTRTPAPVANNTQYGAQFWVTAESPTQGEKIDPTLQGFYMSGSQGQVVLMVPDRDLIVIRLGEAHHAKWSEINAMVSQIARAFPVIESASDT